MDRWTGDEQTEGQLAEQMRGWSSGDRWGQTRWLQALVDGPRDRGEDVAKGTVTGGTGVSWVERRQGWGTRHRQGTQRNTAGWE